MADESEATEEMPVEGEPAEGVEAVEASDETASVGESDEEAQANTSDAAQDDVSLSAQADPIPGTISGRPYVNFAAGDYVIRSYIGNRVLDMDDALFYANGGNAKIWEPLDDDTQIFNIKWDKAAYIIAPKGSGKVLEVAGSAATATRANVQQYEDEHASDQRWLFEDAGDGWVYIRKMNAYYLDVQDGKNRNDANVQTWYFNGTSAQKWKVVRASGTPVRYASKTSEYSSRIADGDYLIRSAVGTKYLDVSGASTANGANVRIMNGTSGPSQIFRIGWNDDLSANNIRLAQWGNENRFLDCAGGDGTGNVQQWEGNGGYNQNWWFEDAGNGWYYIRNIYGYYLHVKGGKNVSGTNVVCWTFTGSKAQKWKLVRPTVTDATVTGLSSRYYTGKAIKPNPKVVVGGLILTKGTDYTLSYKNNVKVGTATVTIKGKGSYSGSVSKIFKILPSVSYYVHRQTYGWEDAYSKKNGAQSGTTGESKRLEGICIKPASTVSGSIQYRTHIQTYGWEDSWRSNGLMSGTTGQSKRLEAIQIKLTGNLAKSYDVWYRVHAQNFGWMGWAKNGASAGTAGYSYRLEAIQIVLKPKGSSAPAATYKGATQMAEQAFAQR